MFTKLEKSIPPPSAKSNPVEKQGFSHFMVKEIYEQAEVVRVCLEAFLASQSSSDLLLPASSHQPMNLGLSAQVYNSIDQVQILACGSSLHASLVGKYLLEQLAGVPTIVQNAAEFGDAPPPLYGQPLHALLVGVTQSGETADTLGALEIELARRCTQPSKFEPVVLGITNQPGSSLEKLVHHSIHTRAGIEVAIAATKTFVAQFIAFYCLAVDIAYCRQTISPEQLNQILAGLAEIPAKIDMILESQKHSIEELARDLAHIQNFIFLGRGINFPIALEGALKLKETSYIHAQGYHAGEFMHGPIAMLDSQVAVVAIAMPGIVCEKVLANAQKAKEVGARLIGVTSINHSDGVGIFDDVLSVPEVDELLSPILSVIPLQLLAYYLAVHRGLDVDRPRNLKKAITD